MIKSEAVGADCYQNSLSLQRYFFPHLLTTPKSRLIFLTSSERTIFCRGRTAQEREKNRPIASIGGSRDRPNATMSIQPKT
jgi:hypothetical protein